MYKTWHLIVARTCMSHGWIINYCQSDADANVSHNTSDERWRVCNWIWFNSLYEGNNKVGLVLCRSQPSAGEVDRSCHNVRLKQRDSHTGRDVFWRVLLVNLTSGEVADSHGELPPTQTPNQEFYNNYYRIIHTQHLGKGNRPGGGGRLPGSSCLEILNILCCFISPSCL